MCVPADCAAATECPLGILVCARFFDKNLVSPSMESIKYEDNGVKIEETFDCGGQ